MDDSFKLTPVDIRAQEFRRGLRGYLAQDVDDFRVRVAEEMERLLRERAQLEERLHNYKEQLKAFRDRERAMNDALLAAQQMSHQIEEAARREAELVLREARADADAIIARARDAEVNAQRDLDQVQRQFSAYVAGFRRLLERHLAEVDVISEHEVDGSPPAGSGTAE